MNEIETKFDKPATQTRPQAFRRPTYEVWESPDDFQVQVAMPGVTKDGLDVSLEEDILLITGTRAQKTPETWKPLRREISGHDFRLALRLNVAVDPSKISAMVEDGMLCLTLPKAEEVKPRKITIK